MRTFKPIKKRLGDLLVDTGLITSSQLSDALELQRKKGIRIGRALLELKYVSEDLLLAFLGRQCGISYVSIKEFGEIDEQAIRALPECLAREWEVFPLSISSDGKITVAVSDPFNLSAIDDLGLITGHEVKTVIAPSEEIKNFIEKYYVRKGLAGPESNLPHGERDYSLKLLLRMAVSLGATDIYLSADSLRASYFLSNRHLKTVELAVNESESLESFFAKTKDDFVIFEVSGANAHLLLSDEDWDVKKAPPHNSRFAAFLTPPSQTIGQSRRIKIRELPSSPSHKRLTDFGIASDDLMIIEKHIFGCGQGVVAISSEPSGGKTYFLEAAAAAFSAPHRVGYFFHQGFYKDISGSSCPNLSRRIFELSANDNTPPSIIYAPVQEVKNFLPAPANVIFCDSSSEDILPEICASKDNSLVVAAIPSEFPSEIIKCGNPRLYIRLKLARRLCPECRIRYAVSTDYLVNSGIVPQDGFPPMDRGSAGMEDIILSKSTGCEFCARTGYNGFALAYYISESLPDEPYKASKQIRDGISKSLWSLALKGDISVEEVILYKITHA